MPLEFSMKKDRRTDAFITDDDEGAGWMVTYADLMTLLLVFFVLLYSISSTETKQFMSAVESLRHQMEESGLLPEQMEILQFPDYGSQQIPLEQRIGLQSRQDAIVRDINRNITQNHDSNDIKSFVHMGKIVIRIDGRYVFSPGSAELNIGFIPVLRDLKKIMDRFPDYILNIKGHTDDTFISSKRYPSNWELSSARATEVLKYLIQSGVAPERLTATGYGATLPLVPNNSTENRAKNRRVEFVLEKETTQF